eukprot:3810984-Amphidinium_carterae.1
MKVQICFASTTNRTQCQTVDYGLLQETFMQSCQSIATERCLWCRQLPGTRTELTAFKDVKSVICHLIGTSSNASQYVVLASSSEASGVDGDWLTAGNEWKLRQYLSHLPLPYWPTRHHQLASRICTAFIIAVVLI